MLYNRSHSSNRIKENFIIGIIKTHGNFSEQRIINSYENVKREEPRDRDWTKIEAIENEKDIKDCEIYINEEKINFNYFHVFKKDGTYIIKFVFKKYLKSTNFMFYDCNSYIYFDFTNFNTNNIINMCFMFTNSKSLINLNIIQN